MKGKAANGPSGKQIEVEPVLTVRPEALEGRSPRTLDAGHRRDASSTLALLQLNDSAFPSGAFAHSYGLEQLARERRVTSASEVEAFVTGVLWGTLSTAEAPAAYRAASEADGALSEVVSIDKALYRTKAAAELRAASVQTGRRVLEETAPYCDDAMLQAYAEAVRGGRSPGTHAVAFGVACAAMGVAVEAVPGALMLGAVSAMLQASMRILPVSHRDVQAALHRLRPLIAALAATVVATGAARPLLSFQPLQEIASMRHTRATVRLFAS